MERQAIRACDQGQIDKALDLFGQAIQIAPDRAACYNNRAQVLRLKGLNAEARADLNKAIQVSRGEGRSACQAYMQRGEKKYVQSHSFFLTLFFFSFSRIAEQVGGESQGGHGRF